MAEMTPARKAMLKFMVAIVVLHTTFIAAYYLTDVPAMSPWRQRGFGFSWIAITAALVFGGLQRIKRARRGR